MDLFSGIGGMTLALQGASKPALYCDNCPHAQATLRKQMAAGALEDAPIVDDIRKIGATGEIDCIAGGFPCTGFSTSGRMQGFTNECSALFFELVRVCREVQPKVVFMENTPWIAQADNIAQVQSAFMPLGYKLKYCILPAYAVGLPQSRFRWFAIAYKCDQQFLLDLQANLKPHPNFPPPPPPRSIVVEDKSAFRRYGLLRNALVPECARFALHYLLGPATATHPKFMKPNLSLVLQDGDFVIKKTLWPTLHGHYARKGSKLTVRTSYDIGTALGYEVGTQPGHVNIRFLEWMMGFPTDWTI